MQNENINHVTDYYHRKEISKNTVFGNLFIRDYTLCTLFNIFYKFYKHFYTVLFNKEEQISYLLIWSITNVLM